MCSDDARVRLACKDAATHVTQGCHIRLPDDNRITNQPQYYDNADGTKATQLPADAEQKGHRDGENTRCYSYLAYRTNMADMTLAFVSCSSISCLLKGTDRASPLTHLSGIDQC